MSTRRFWRVERVGQALVSEPLFLGGVEFCGLSGQACSRQAVQLVSQCRLDGLTAIAEALLGHQCVDLFEQVGVDSQSDFGLRHPGMMNYHTIASL